MNRIFLVFTILSLSTASTAEPVLEQSDFLCGDAQVKVLNSEDIQDPTFRVLVSQDDQKLEVSYSAQKEFLFVRCEQTREGEAALLVNHVCGGSGCVESNFGIIDPQHLKVLLTPNPHEKDNSVLAEKILGNPVKPFTCKNPSRGSYATPSNGEFCYVSPLELG